MATEFIKGDSVEAAQEWLQMLVDTMCGPSDVGALECLNAEIQSLGAKIAKYDTQDVDQRQCLSEYAIRIEELEAEVKNLQECGSSTSGPDSGVSEPKLRTPQEIWAGLRENKTKPWPMTGKVASIQVKERDALIEYLRG